jgi:hypothetical protein
MPLTDWHQMIVAEPELGALERDVEAYVAASRRADEWDLEQVWAYGFKPRMDALVGWKSLRACLQSSASWHVAYDRLYGRLMAKVEATR